MFEFYYNLLFFVRIQQLQLLGREMRGEIRDKLWRQLEAEILLHRHKAVIRACRNRGPQSQPQPPPSNDADVTNLSPQGIGEPRYVTVQRDSGEGLGISITVNLYCSYNLKFFVVRY